MEITNLNYLAVFVSAIAVMVLGALWYGPLFGRLWMQLSGITNKEIDDSNKSNLVWILYLINFISIFVTAYVTAHFIYFVGADTLKEGLQTGFWIWLGFIATFSLGMVIWEAKPFKLYILTNTYHLISFLMVGSILALWK